MGSLRAIILAGFIFLATTASSYGVVLTTTFASNDGASGNYFDVVTLGGALNVSRLDVNLVPGSYTLELFARSGTFVSHTTSSVGWTLVGAVNVTSVAVNSPTQFDVAFTLPANAITGLYFSTSAPTGVRYTDGTGIGNVVASNADLQILEGSGASAPAFSGSFSNRIWNGSIYYTLASVPEMDPRSSGTPLTLVFFSLLAFNCRGSRSARPAEINR